MNECLPGDPAELAEASGLRYVSDDEPGIQRLRSGRGFRYLGVAGQLIRDPKMLERIRQLAIPPAWREVWICPSSRGHVQATGRDARHRKQYRYHPHWREARDRAKFEHLVTFGESLPRIRDQTSRDLARPGLPRDRLLAAVVALLETTHIRVGSEIYARQNGSFGLTTLRASHITVVGAEIKFRFRGKSGKVYRLGLRHRRLAKLVRRCQDLPGQTLFRYLDEEGSYQAIKSEDVNEYLRQVTGANLTAKDFRTWAGTLLAAEELVRLPPAQTRAEAERNLLSAVDTAAECLGNTRSVCRSCYIHPAVLEAYLDGSLTSELALPEDRESTSARLSLEQGLIRLLIQRNSGMSASTSDRRARADSADVPVSA